MIYMVVKIWTFTCPQMLNQIAWKRMVKVLIFDSLVNSHVWIESPSSTHLYSQFMFKSWSVTFNHHIVHYNTSKDDVKGFGHIPHPTRILNYYPLGLENTKCPLHNFLCFLLHFDKNIVAFHLGVHVWFAQNLKARFHMQENN